MNERRGSNASQQSRFFLMLAGLLEVVVTSFIVVGFFSAASQPFCWSSAVQIAICAFLGGLLWYADRSLQIDDSPAIAADSVVARRTLVRR